jgi:hypothetical protein
MVCQFVSQTGYLTLQPGNERGYLIQIYQWTTECQSGIVFLEPPLNLLNIYKANYSGILVLVHVRHWLRQPLNHWLRGAGVPKLNR